MLTAEQKANLRNVVCVNKEGVEDTSTCSSLSSTSSAYSSDIDVSSATSISTSSSSSPYQASCSAQMSGATSYTTLPPLGLQPFNSKNNFPPANIVFRANKRDIRITDFLCAQEIVCFGAPNLRKKILLGLALTPEARRLRGFDTRDGMLVVNISAEAESLDDALHCYYPAAPDITSYDRLVDAVDTLHLLDASASAMKQILPSFNAIAKTHGLELFSAAITKKWRRMFGDSAALATLSADQLCAGRPTTKSQANKPKADRSSKALDTKIRHQLQKRREEWTKRLVPALLAQLDIHRRTQAFEAPWITKDLALHWVWHICAVCRPHEKPLIVANTTFMDITDWFGDIYEGVVRTFVSRPPTADTFDDFMVYEFPRLKESAMKTACKSCKERMERDFLWFGKELKQRIALFY